MGERLVVDCGDEHEAALAVIGDPELSLSVDLTPDVEHLLRVLPESEFRWVGRGWLWSPVYVTMKMLGSMLLRSTCFLAGHPFELLHR